MIGTPNPSRSAGGYGTGFEKRGYNSVDDFEIITALGKHFLTYVERGY
jgi:hypothetical protein